MSSVPDDPSDAEADKAAADLEPLVVELTDALAEATALMEKNQAKRSLAPRSCGDACILGKAQGLVVEVTATLRPVISILGASTSPQAAICFTLPIS